MVTRALKQHKEENNFAEFYKKLEVFVPELKNFLTGSLRNAEDQGLLDRRYFSPDGILDEVFLDAFEGFSDEMDNNKLRRSLFKMAIQKIAAKGAEDIPDEVNTHALLKQELKTLSEDFTTDGAGDRILMEELDDISYLQKGSRELEVQLNDALVKQLIQKFELNEASLLSEEKRKLLGLLYNTIPDRSKQIVELFAFGDQDIHEISEILEVPEEVVERILFKVKERFRLL
ncbi:MAG: hypothetical protein OEQ81_11800 [Flavobacteriaceae bacterium]|nr:hypothetical protein [Flavobacteriaceae bacterium]